MPLAGARIHGACSWASAIAASYLSDTRGRKGISRRGPRRSSASPGRAARQPRWGPELEPVETEILGAPGSFEYLVEHRLGVLLGVANGEGQLRDQDLTGLWSASAPPPATGPFAAP